MDIRRTPLYAESWNVAYRMKSQGTILDDKKSPFVIIPNDKRYWAADPMVFNHNGETFIFAELYDYKRCRGVIGYTKYDGTKFGKWIPIIIEPFHMSYPFVFEKDNDIFMIPETSSGNALMLYKAIDFPNKWEKVKNIVDNVKWVDTSLIKTENGYIGFTEELPENQENVKDYKIVLDNELNLVDKELINDNDSIHRCGGRIFKQSGNYIVVCQDCVEDYGKALYFRICDENLVEKNNYHIDPEDLRYTSKILIDGMHTYTATENFEVIDIKTRRFNIINFFYRLKSKV